MNKMLRYFLNRRSRINIPENIGHTIPQICDYVVSCIKNWIRLRSKTKEEISQIISELRRFQRRIKEKNNSIDYTPTTNLDHHFIMYQVMENRHKKLFEKFDEDLNNYLHKLEMIEKKEYDKILSHIITIINIYSREYLLATDFFRGNMKNNKKN